MANTVRKVVYFTTGASNRPGQAARMLKILHEDNVNLLGFTGFPDSGKAQIDFIPQNPALLQRVAKRAGWKLRKKKIGFLVQGKDRVGAIANVLGKLAAAKINVTAVDAVTAGKGRFGAILWVKPTVVGRAARILRAS